MKQFYKDISVSLTVVSVVALNEILRISDKTDNKVVGITYTFVTSKLKK
jgi:hypothetical protein